MTGNEVSFTISDLNLAKLIPTSQAFYRYLGSMTSPPCSEAVLWSVMSEPLTVTEAQLNVFRALHISKGQASNPDDRLLDNFRPLQNLNMRLVTFSPQIIGLGSGQVTEVPKTTDAPTDESSGQKPIFSLGFLFLFSLLHFGAPVV